MSCSRITRFGPDPLLDQEVATKFYVDNSGGGVALGNVIQSVDESRTNDTTLSDALEMLFPLEINSTYMMITYFFIDGSASFDLKSRWTLPTDVTSDSLTGTSVWRNQESNTQDSSSTIATGVNGVPIQYYVNAFRIITGSTAGNIQWQFAQNTSGATPTTIKQGSMLVIYKL